MNVNSSQQTTYGTLTFPQDGYAAAFALRSDAPVFDPALHLPVSAKEGAAPQNPGRRDPGSLLLIRFPGGEGLLSDGRKGGGTEGGQAVCIGYTWSSPLSFF